MDVCVVIKQRLRELGFEQRDLATAAEVTESYISQLLTGKKLPPEPGRTDIYDKIGKFETSERQALKAGRASAQRGIKEKLGPTQAIVQRSSRADSPQVRARQRGPNTGDFREATLRRTRAPRHTKAVGHCQESREKRVGE